MTLQPDKKTRKTDRLAVIAAFILAIACLIASIYQIKLLLPLLNDGKKAEAIVIDIRTGAKDSKTAIYQFKTETGTLVTSQDIFQMYFTRFHKGEHISVIYDPANPETVTADPGFWIWQGPVIFIFGFILFSTLGIFIVFYMRKRDR